MALSVAANPDVADAVRDTVHIRGTSAELSGGRHKVHRSQTAVPAPSPNDSKPSPGRRSQSEDSVTLAANAVTKLNSKSRKKGGASQHSDIIDSLDFTGMGPTFHHDGPFDACAPSRNRHRNKAPMLAWSARGEQTRLAAGGGSPYDAAGLMMMSDHGYDVPKKKVDAIAEAWGIHEPEPFEEFSAGGGRRDGETPASSIYNGDTGVRPATKDQYRASPTPQGDNERRGRGASKRNLPPPQPIFVPDTVQSKPTDPYAVQSSPGAPSSGAPKRTKSLMHRIRRMRDAPNVPVSDYEQVQRSPTQAYGRSGSQPARPTHRPQNSFLGRLGGHSNRSPQTEKSEPFVLIEPRITSSNKELPVPPADEPHDGADDAGYFSDTQYPSTPNGGLGRKSSLMKKMGRVVRGGTK
ncbi:hypothetical protein FISHEDRAFT_38785 [Fistulina hepatica ATCC 64428]|uniref:Pal1-domain-containing protein n=1 Tax=Fistulina hepatica ATCC 64428 TaxID=1128425 RepID=A0A0D7AGG5_9AGAR|nr:hypothetical protein FISHEDRAFT_38785 [Fistulina hepatica ATCC 64428]